jgi:hypothetical protein
MSHGAMPDTRVYSGVQMSKYNARRTDLDGHTFASAAEARRYQELKLMEVAGEIIDLTLQPKYKIELNGQHICYYIADFRYQPVRGDSIIIEDVKGFKTPVYRLKKKLMLAVYGIMIQEVE